MMGSYVRTNAVTLGKSLTRLALIGGTAVLGYVAFRQLPAYRADRASEKRAEEIVTAIGDGQGDLTVAQTLYSEFTLKGLLQEDEAILLRGKLHAAQLTQDRRRTEDTTRLTTVAFDQQFNTLLADNKLDDAVGLLSGSAVPYTAPQLGELRSRVEELREPNLGKRLQLASAAEKIPLAADYLKRYPQGSYRKDAATFLIIGAESDLATTLTQPDTTLTYAALVKLNLALEVYGKVALLQPATLEELLKNTEQYLAPPAVPQPEASLASPTPESPIPASPAPAAPESSIPSLGVGSLVWHGLPDAPTLPKYLKERNQNFGNSTGRVIAIKDSTAYVQFEGGPYQWSTKWGWIRSYIDSGSSNVATYKLSELLPAGVQSLPHTQPSADQAPPPSPQPPTEKPEGVKTHAPNLNPNKSPIRASPTLLEQYLFRLELEKLRQYGGAHG